MFKINTKYIVVSLPILIILIATALYINSSILNRDEIAPVNEGEAETVTNSYVGVVDYVNPNHYPDDKITHVLNDVNGNEIILLVADDDKLDVVEGLSVELFGKKLKTKDGKIDILKVERIVVKNK